MKNKLISILSLAIALNADLSFAEGICPGCYIKNIGTGPYYDSVCSSTSCAFIELKEDVVGRPPCATNQGWDFALDTSTASGKSTYSQLLAAFTAQKKVNISGSNQCNISPSGLVEDLYFINFSE